MERPDVLDRGEAARLIPVTSDSNREARAASIFLATLMSVPPFAREVLSTVEQRVGARTKIRCFTEIRFKNDDNVNSRPDGLIAIDSGQGRSWTCLVEAKIGNAELSAEQVEAYLQIARANDVDAVLTISNQFVALPTHSPVKVSRTLLRNVQLYHWSWIYLKTAASLLLSADELESAEQKYILSEFHRYFDHDSVGVNRFDRMNSEWKEIVGQVIAKATLNRSSVIVENTVGAWHQEARDLCLLLTEKVRHPVKLRLSRAHANDPNERLRDDCERLASDCELACALEVPDAAAPMIVCANLRGRSISVSMELDAPKDKQRPLSRLNWLLRQLSKARPDDIYIRCNWPGRAPSTQNSLADVRNRPEILFASHENAAPVSFEVLLVRDIASKFSGARTFIEQLEEAVPYFYAEVGEHLRTYIPPPPRLQTAKDEAEAREPFVNKQDAPVILGPVQNVGEMTRPLPSTEEDPNPL